MANKIKQLASFAVLNLNGGNRVSYTYDEIDAATGNMISSNNKESFYAVDEELQSHILSIRQHIIDNKLSEE